MTVETVLSHPIVPRLGWTLVHFVWQGAAVAVLLAVVMLLLRHRSANSRYVAACTALLLMAALPLITVQMVSLPVVMEDKPVLVEPASADLRAEMPSGLPVPTSVAPADYERSGILRGGTAVPPIASHARLPWWKRVSYLFEPTLPWVVCGWLVGVLALSLRLLGGWVQAQRLKRRFVQPASDRWRAILADLARRLRVSRPVRLLESTLAKVPTVVGWFRPVVLLPAGVLTGLSPLQVEALIAHELAHIRRYDYLVNLLQTVIETLLFYHPAVWWVSHRIRVEREHCCDDLAVAACGDALSYARALAELEQLRGETARLAVASSGGSLIERVRRLVGATTADTNRSAWWLAGVIAIAVIIAMATAVQISGSPPEVGESSATASGEPEASAAIPAWYLLKQTDVGPLLSPLVVQMAKALDPSAQSAPMWQSESQPTKVTLDIRAEGDESQEIVVGFFSRHDWLEPPVHVRRLPGPGTYTLTDIPPGRYYLGAVMGMPAGPLPVAGNYRTSPEESRLPELSGLGVHESWPYPTTVEKDLTAELSLLVSPDMKGLTGDVPRRTLACWMGNWREMWEQKKVTVRTVDASGNAIPFCRITFATRGDRVEFLQSGTDADGYAYCDEIGGPFSIAIAQRFSFDPGTMADRCQLKRLSTIYQAEDRPVITIQFDPFPGGSGKITGRVHDQRGNPLTEYYLQVIHEEGDLQGWDDLLMTLYHLPVVDPDGQFEVTGVPPGEYRLNVRHFDYQAYVWKVGGGIDVAVPDEEDAVADVDIEVEAKELRYGRALYDDGRPVYPGYWTVKFDTLRDPRWHRYFSWKTDADGSFRVCLCEQERKDLLENTEGMVEISDDSGTLGDVHIDKLSNDADNPHTITFPRPGEEASAQPRAHDVVTAREMPEIKGRVTDESGKPVSGALVEWGFLRDPPERRDRTTTDADGQYRLRVTQSGAGFRLGVSAKGFAPVWYDLYPPWNHVSTVSDRDATPPTERDFDLGPAHQLEGVVVDQEGQPISGAVVKARTSVDGIWTSFSSPSSPTMIPGDDAFETRSDAEGTFRFDGLPAESVNLNVAAPHRHVNDRNYPVDSPCRIVMSGSGRPGRIRVRVTDQRSGEPIADFKVARRYFPEQRRVLNPDGRFEWKDELTESKEYSFHVYAKGYAPWRGPLKASALDGEETLTVALLPGQPLLGRLVDVNTEKPVAGASVLFGHAGDARYFEWSDWGNYIDGHHSVTCVQRATTDRDGRFWFCEDVFEAGALVIAAPGYARNIIPPEDRPPTGPDGLVQIALHPEAVIRGTLLADGRARSNANMMLWREEPRGQLEETFETAKTGADGRFEFNRLAPGTYHVSLERWLTRYSTTTEPIESITLGAGETRTLGQVTVSMVGEGGATIDGAVQDGRQGDGEAEQRPVWVTLMPRSPIRTLKEYHHTFRARSLIPEGAEITSCEFEIRSASDNVQIARSPYVAGTGTGPLRDALASGKIYKRETSGGGMLTESERRRIGDLADGDYLTALIVNGVRCSNVAQLTIDSDFDPQTEPTLKLIPLDAGPGLSLPYLGIRAIGPTPQDPELTNYVVAFPRIFVDGVEPRRSAILWVGPVGPLQSGQIHTRILDISTNLEPPIDPGTPHEIYVKVGKYESAPITLEVDETLARVWDEASTDLKAKPPPRALLRGKVIGPDGQPAGGYEAFLWRDPDGLTTYCNSEGVYEFYNISPGEYQLTCHPPGKGQPELVKKNVRIETHRTRTLDLSFAPEHTISGKVTTSTGEPVAGMEVMSSWEGPDETGEFNDFATTDAQGRYTLNAPFPVASYVGISGTGPQPRPYHDVAAGRTDINFVLVDSKDSQTPATAIEEDERAWSEAESISRELRQMLAQLAMIEFDDSRPDIPDGLKELILELQPPSGDALLEIIADPEDDLNRRATNVLIKVWNSLSPRQIETYFKAAMTASVDARPEYPQGLKALVDTGYQIRYGWGGWPDVDDITIRTTSYWTLDGRRNVKPFHYEGPAAGTGWIPLYDLSLGRHTAQTVTGYEVTYDGRTYSGTVRSEDVTFQIVSADTPDHLVAPSDPEVDELVRRSFQISQTRERPQGSYSRGLDSAWPPQIHGRRQGEYDEWALCVPVYDVTEPLPVDLCFEVQLHLEETAEVFEGDPIVVPRGEVWGGHFFPRHGLRDFVEGREGFIPLRVVLTPSRELALTSTKVTQYYNRSITSPVLRAKGYRYRQSEATDLQKELQAMLERLRQEEEIDEGLLYAIEDLASLSPYRRVEGASRLAQMYETDRSPAIPFLIKLLADSESSLASYPAGMAEYALGRAGEPAIQPLVAALDDENPDVRRRAAYALNGIDSSKDLHEKVAAHALEPLIALLQEDEEPSVRAAAAHALHRTTDARVLEPLLRALGDEDATVREKAAMALEHIKAIRGRLKGERVPAAEQKPPAEPVAEEKVVNISVFNNCRPLESAAIRLRKQHGLRVSYEDVRCAYAGDLEERAITNPSTGVTHRNLVPRKGRVDLSYAVSNETNKLVDPLGALEELCRVHEMNGNPGRFEVRTLGSMFCIVPTMVRNEEGDWQQARPVLDTVVSFPEEERTALETVSLLLNEVEKIVQKDFPEDVVGMARIPFNRFSQTKLSIGASNECARDVLVRILNQMEGKFSYAVGYTTNPKNNPSLMCINFVR